MTATDLTLEDIGIKHEIPTEVLETFYERALMNRQQIETYLHVVGRELDGRHAGK